MKCPVCGAAELIRDTRDIAYTYKGESTMTQPSQQIFATRAMSPSLTSARPSA